MAPEHIVHRLSDLCMSGQFAVLRLKKRARPPGRPDLASSRRKGSRADGLIVLFESTDYLGQRADEIRAKTWGKAFVNP